MFYLDKVVMKWIIVKCTHLGNAFFLGPIGGAVMYILFIMFAISIALDKKGTAKK